MKTKYWVALAVAAAGMIVVPLILYRRPPPFLKSYFSEAVPALNLAVFRIVLFAAILWHFSPSTLIRFSSLPREFLFPPPGTGWTLSFLPLEPAFAAVASAAFLAAAFLAMIGWFTPAACAATAALGLYTFGVPQLYGKINHHHHLIWFAAILAASPCGDALSADAIRAQWRSNSLPLYPRSPESIAYAMPLRFIWLLMGALYFWAGVWKLWTGRLEWAFSDNLRFIMYDKWLELGGWLPPLRIDHYPPAFQWSAAFSILFEISFPALILFPRTRVLAAAGGLAFHNMTNLFMRISFWQMQVCYAAFVDWRKLFAALGRRWFAGELTVSYDGTRSFCRKTIAVFQQLDLLGRIRYQDAAAESPADGIAAASGDRRLTGFDACRKIALRIPPLWPAVAFLYLPPVAAAGRILYRRLAAGARELPVAARETFPARSWRPAAAAGAVLIFAAVLSSVAKYHSWPFAGYPTFEDLTLTPETVVLAASGEVSGRSIEFHPLQDRWLPWMPPESYRALLNRILALEGPARELRLRKLWCAAREHRPELRPLRNVRLYSDVVSTLPDRWRDPPLRRTLLAGIPDSPCPEEGARSLHEIIPQL